MRDGLHTVLSRFHWNVVDGCESERTGFHWPPANWSTVRNVCSRRRLFYRSRQHGALILPASPLTLGFALKTERVSIKRRVSARSALTR